MLIWRWGQNHVRQQRELLSSPIEAFLSSEEMAAAQTVPAFAIEA